MLAVLCEVRSGVRRSGRGSLSDECVAMEFGTEYGSKISQWYFKITRPFTHAIPDLTTHYYYHLVTYYLS